MTVNRLWHQIFGTGLVKTVDDFGVQGEYPESSGTARLSGLRVPGRRLEWNGTGVEHQAYPAVDRDQRDLSPGIHGTHRPRAQRSRQPAAGAFPPPAFDRRGNPRSGALRRRRACRRKLGGPPVFPYQPAGLWEERANEGSNTRSISAARASRCIAAASIHSGSEPARRR